MQYSTRTADAVHILVLIALHEGNLSSQALAKSTASSPPHIRKLMSQLRNGGLLSSCCGKADPVLLRASGEISLLDIYRIMEHETPLLHLDTHTNPDCREGVHIQHALQEQYDALQNAFGSRMAQVSLQDIMDRFEERRTQTRGH
ncbi:Rrf2 family transcriptional regulator [Faecalibaculum rodentium]|jgi:Rrf2 family protein|uniref:Rrf2 family transcriptional regulator n=1 Tax=Faecalibaculum rodentium TaxID=1702221 RepID=UPI00256ECAED|nr:Rrf2 family transcriptional regulator [Faecalibaculum rodentium]